MRRGQKSWASNANAFRFLLLLALSAGDGAARRARDLGDDGFLRAGLSQSPPCPTGPGSPTRVLPPPAPGGGIQSSGTPPRRFALGPGYSRSAPDPRFYYAESSCFAHSDRTAPDLAANKPPACWLEWLTSPCRQLAPPTCPPVYGRACLGRGLPQPESAITTRPDHPLPRQDLHLRARQRLKAAHRTLL